MIVLGLVLVFKDYASGPIGQLLDWLRGFDAARPFVTAIWPFYRRTLAEPSQTLEAIHIVGMVVIAVALALILWRSQRPPERDPG
jgi:hypothetical protein